MKYKVLLIEDRELDQLHFKKMVKQENLPYNYTIATSLSQAKQILNQQQFDIILTTHQLKDGTGLEILKLKINEPVIIIIDSGKEEIAIQAMQLGAYNYLIKDTEQNYLKVLPLTLENTLQRKKAEVTSALLSEAMIKIRDSVYIIEPEDDKIIFVNQAFTETYGYKSQEIIGQTSKQLWAETPCNENRKNLRCSIGSSQEREEYNHKRKDQTQFPVSLSCSQIESNGKTLQVFVTHDITSRKQAEAEIQKLNEQLQERTKLLETANQELEKEINIRKKTEETLQSTLSLQQAILDSAGYAIISSNRNCQIHTFNKAAQNLLGYTEQEALGQNPISFLHDSQEINKYIKETSAKLGRKTLSVRKLFLAKIKAHKTFEREWTYIRKNQTKVPVLLSLTAMHDKAGNITGFLVIASDITERKRAEEDRQKFVSLIENSSDFIAMASLEGEVFYINEAGRKMIGLDLTENIISTKLCDYLSENAWETFLDIVIPSVMQQGHWEGEAQLRHFKTNNLIHTQATLFTVRHPETGDPLCLATVQKNITEQKLSQEALRVSEQRLQAIIDNSPAAISLKNTAGRYILINRQFETLFNISREEIKGLKNQDVFPSEIAKIITENDSKVMREKAALEFEEIKPYKGENNTYLSIKFPLYHTPEIISAICTISTDITERKRTEEILQLSQERFQLLTRATNDAVWDWDLATNSIWWGPGFHSLFGYDLETVEPNFDFWSKNVYLQDRERIVSKIGCAINEDESSFTNEYRFRRADGTWANVLDRGYILRNSTGKPVRIIGAIMDITERKQGEQALQTAHNELEKRVLERTLQLAKTNEMLKTEILKKEKAEAEIRGLNSDLEKRVIERTAQLEAANKELEAFSYSVSHDLRAPLRSIDGFSLALLQDCSEQLDDIGKDYLNRVREAAQRMGQLIEDLLNLSRITRSELRREPVNLSKISQEIADNLQALDRTRQVEFIIQQTPIATGDSQLLKIALENLLGNSWKYTSKHPNARIEFGVLDPQTSAEKQQQNYPINNHFLLHFPSNLQNIPVYFVRDDGAGFNMARAQKLFGVFQRMHRPTQFEGTGVGLATVQRIIHRHGGRVWASSAVEAGATFYFTLASNQLQESEDINNGK